MADKHERFENEGVVFKAKLIGSELVMEPRGDKMCQNSIQRLKAIIKGTNSHKKRIVLKVSFDGVKVFDEKTNEMLHHHEVSQISYIASDDTDSRTFGYVSDVPNKAHQFICFKTSGPAINVMTVISALFEAVLEKKNDTSHPGGEKKLVDDGDEINKKSLTKKIQDSVDLIGDSGIMEGDSSIIADDDTNMKRAGQQQNWSNMLENSIGSPDNSFSSTCNNTSTMRSKQSAGNDLIFDDLFASLSDPIIVGKDDSLISYKRQDPSNTATPPTDVINRPYGGAENCRLIISPPNTNACVTTTNTNITSSSRKIPPSLPRSTHHPIPRRQHNHQQGILLPPPSSLPRPAPMMMSSVPTHNRSLVYNHSSVSLSDAALTRQPSFGSSLSAAPNESHVDRYAVFNDIDNLPSIFESTSLGSVNKVVGTTPLEPLSSSMVTSVAVSRSTSTAANMFRQTNPFDDEFFA